MTASSLKRRCTILVPWQPQARLLPSWQWWNYLAPPLDDDGNEHAIASSIAGVVILVVVARGGGIMDNAPCATPVACHVTACWLSRREAAVICSDNEIKAQP